jgi:hypothetical protein
MPEDEQDLYSSVPSSRRSFIKKMVGVAFVAPLISSFSLDALAATPKSSRPRQQQPNQEPEDQDEDEETGEDHDRDERRGHDTGDDDDND